MFGLFNKKKSEEVNIVNQLYYIEVHKVINILRERYDKYYVYNEPGSGILEYTTPSFNIIIDEFNGNFNINGEDVGIDKFKEKLNI